MPPASDLKVTPACCGSASAPVTSRRRFFLDAMIFCASSLADGATITSVNSFTISVAVAASISWLSAMMPPNADVGSQRSALM